MNEFSILIITLLAVYTLTYLSFTFSQELSKRDTFYGIYLEEYLKKAADLVNIKKRFRLKSLLIYIITSPLFISFVILQKPAASPLIILIPILIQLLLYLCIYIEAYKKVKLFKASHIGSAPALSKTLVDTEFIKEKEKLKKFFVILYSIPFTISLGLMFYAIYCYPMLPDVVPTHWNYLGEIDAWTTKSYPSILFPSFIHLFLIILLGFMTLSTLTSRIKINHSNLETSKKNALNYLKGIALGIYLITLSISCIFGSITIAGLDGTNLSPLLLWLNLTSPFIGCLVILYVFVKYGNDKACKKFEEPFYSPENDDKYWLLGFLYNNPHDPAVMVQKRYGLGWTLNIGNIRGKILLILLLIFILFSAFLPFFLN